MVDKNELKSSFLNAFNYEPDGYFAFATPFVLSGNSADISKQKAIIINTTTLATKCVYRKHHDRAFRVVINNGPIVEFVYFDLKKEASSEVNPYRKSILNLLVSSLDHHLLFDGLDLYIECDFDLKTRLFEMSYLSAIAYAIDIAYNRRQSKKIDLIKIVYDSLNKNYDQGYSLMDVIGIFAGNSIIDFSLENDELITPFNIDANLNFAYVDLKGDNINLALHQALRYQLLKASKYFKKPFNEEDFIRTMSRPADSYDGEVIKLKAQYCFDEYHATNQLIISNMSHDGQSMINVLKDITNREAHLLGDNGANNYAHSYRTIANYFVNYQGIAVIPCDYFSAKALIVFMPQHKDFVVNTLMANGLDVKLLKFEKDTFVSGEYEKI